MDFGITFKSDLTVDHMVALAKQAEDAGFSYGWIFDSHILWKECYPVMALLATATKRMKFGTCVTNPAVRDPTVTASLLATLNLISHGRMQLGIGRGDSSRRVLGKKPTTLAELEQCVHTIQDLCSGKEIDYEGKPAKLTWAEYGAPPVWVAGYGPKALAMAGKIGDGVILQFADPDLIEWCLGFVKQGAEEAGRDFKKIQVMAAAPVWMDDDLEKCRSHVRWFPALVANHVVDLVSRYKPEELPPALTGYVKNREGYDYLHHAEVGSSNAGFVTDEVVDRFCLVGPAEKHVARLNRLKEAGVTQFNIYLMCGDEEQTLVDYRKHVLQHFGL